MVWKPDEFPRSGTSLGDLYEAKKRLEWLGITPSASSDLPTEMQKRTEEFIRKSMKTREKQFPPNLIIHRFPGAYESPKLSNIRLNSADYLTDTLTPEEKSFAPQLFPRIEGTRRFKSDRQVKVGMRIETAKFDLDLYKSKRERAVKWRDVCLHNISALAREITKAHDDYRDHSKTKADRNWCNRRGRTYEEEILQDQAEVQHMNTTIELYDKAIRECERVIRFF